MKAIARRPNVMRLLTMLAMFSPTSRMRVYFNRLRGCKIGANCWLGDQVFLDVHPRHPEPERCVVIGDNVAIGPSTKVFTHDSSRWQVTGKRTPIKFVRVEIGSNVWIGPNSFIYRAKIGSNCIVAPHSVVKEDVPDNSLASGNPCKISELNID